MWIPTLILESLGILTVVGFLFMHVSGSDTLSELTTVIDPMWTDGLHSPLPFSSGVCWNFSAGNRELGELYSPNYGQNYPSKTECVHLISAPDRHKVRLDFSNDFRIESSEECNNDHLEVRDGPFGYSPTVGRFCGSRRPPMIESSGRYLWLRFYSDDSIEYQGFRAVYEFYAAAAAKASKSGRDGGEACRIDVDGILGRDGTASESDIPAEVRHRSNRTKVPLDCTWIFQASSPIQTVFLRWQRYVMSTVHLCEDSFLEVYDGTTGQMSRRQTFCDSNVRNIRSNTNTLYLRLYARSIEKMPYFTVLYTYLLPGPCLDDASLFDCGDRTCIDRSLVCNSHLNCNTSRDENQCNRTTQLLNHDEIPVTIRYHTLIIAIVGGIVLTITVLAVCAVYRQSSKDRQLRRHLAVSSTVDSNQRHGVQRFELTDFHNAVAGAPAAKAPTAEDGGPERPGTRHGGEGIGGDAACSLTANHYESRRLRRLSNGGRPQTNVTSRLCQFVVGGGGTDLELLRRGEDHQSRGCSQELIKDPDDCDWTGQRARVSPGTGAADAAFHEAVYCPAQNVISAVATIEKFPSPPPPSSTTTAARDGWDSSRRRDSTPSPRPDVVQDEKFFPVTFVKSSGKRGSAPSPPVRRLPAKTTPKRETKCSRTRSFENTVSANVNTRSGGDLLLLQNDDPLLGGDSLGDPEMGRSYRRLDDGDRRHVDGSARTFVRFSPDWSASVTLRRPPFPNDYSGLESTPASAGSAPSLILPLCQNRPVSISTAYGSFHPGTTNTSINPVLPDASTSTNRSRLSSAASSSVPPLTNAVKTAQRTTDPAAHRGSSSAAAAAQRGRFGDPSVPPPPGETKGVRSSTFARTEPQNRSSRRRSKSPDIFYTRPSRGILKHPQ